MKDTKLSIVARALYNGPAMKIPAAAILLAGLAPAADMEGFFRGAVAGFDGTPALGVLRARDGNGEIYTCGFDSKSYLELEKRRVTVEKLMEGDPVEVVAYRHPKNNACYILTLTVVAPPRPVRPTRRIDMSPPKAARPVQVRRGSENVAGVVTRIGSNSVTIRTRNGEETFLLRRDTRYFGDGLSMERSDVTVNQRVNVEAARTSDGEMEAFQLTWGGLSVR